MNKDSFKDSLLALAWKQYLLNTDTKLVADTYGISVDEILDQVNRIFDRIDKTKNSSK